MSSIVQDRPYLDVDLLFANAVANPRPWLGPSFPSRAGHLLPPGAFVLGDARMLDEAPIGVEVIAVGAASDWTQVEVAIDQGLDTRLRALDRPVRFLAARWSNAAVELVERLEALDVPIDHDLVPRVLGGTVGYWNSKIGTAELLQSIPAVASRLPPSTVVASPAEAIAVAVSHGSATVLKANGAIGGIGIVAVDPGVNPSDLRSQLQATSVGGATGKKAVVDLDGPYVLQSVVGSERSWSPSLDFLVTAHESSCIAAAEQVLDGFRYQGARFPGRTHEAGLTTCAELGGQVAERVRELGYRGLLNLDFVVDGDEVWLIEINARQSAPLDQSLRMTAAYGAGWRDAHGFELLEDDGNLAPW